MSYQNVLGIVAQQETTIETQAGMVVSFRRSSLTVADCTRYGTDEIFGRCYFDDGVKESSSQLKIENC